MSAATSGADDDANIHAPKDKQSKSTLTLTHQQMKEIKKTFALFDHDNNGRITTTEIGTVLRSLGQNPTNAQLAAIMNQADEKGKGFLNMDDFVALMANKYKEIDSEEAEIRNAFKVFDHDNNGYISVPGLKRILMSIGDTLTSDEIDDLLREADLNQDGLIDYDEFSKVLAHQFL